MIDRHAHGRRGEARGDVGETVGLALQIQHEVEVGEARGERRERRHAAGQAVGDEIDAEPGHAARPPAFQFPRRDVERPARDAAGPAAQTLDGVQHAAHVVPIAGRGTDDHHRIDAVARERGGQVVRGAALVRLRAVRGVGGVRMPLRIDARAVSHRNPAQHVRLCFPEL